MKKVIFTSLITAISLLAGEVSLAQKAKNAGLLPIEDASKYSKDIPAEKIALGKQLYFDGRLSQSGIISCNTCHHLGMGGTDGVEAAVGHKWTANPHHLNSPTVYNALFANKMFWDGRSPSLEDQAQGPIQAGPEMAMDKEQLVKVLASIKEYNDSFKKLYPKEGLSIVTVGDAIGAFERTLVTPSRFDAFLMGDSKALSQAEQEGLNTFIDKGCASCHTNIGIGNNGMMQPFPLMGEYKYANVGDFKGNKHGLVKVPTLRNVAETRPYFHNGAVWSLKEAIKIMGQTQLGVELNDKEVASIETFLQALTGDKPEVTFPTLPASSEMTPKPVL